MTDYPSIKPEDVREGDVVRAVIGNPSPYAGGTVQGNAVAFGDLKFVCDWSVQTLTDLRLVSRPTPPEPPLRVGDWVRDNILHREGQITETLSNGHYEVRVDRLRVFDAASLTRIEPPVGWPVGVPTIDAPTVWYFKSTSSGKYVWCGDVEIDFSWADLLAAGGVPALAVTR